MRGIGGLKVANFQKIPHKERMRHIKYRDRQWDKDAEKHDRKLIRQQIAEKEAAMRQEELSYATDKDREVIEEMRRHGLLEEVSG